MSDVLATIQGKMLFMGLMGKMLGGKGKDGKVEAMEKAGAIAIAHTMDELFDYINK